MSYVNCAVIPVPNDNKDAYLEQAVQMAAIFRDHGALSVVDCWADQIAPGQETSFLLAVKAKDNETIVISWIVWPSKDVAHQGMGAAMQDPRMSAPEGEPVFDGRRLIFGGFDMMHES
jgi:uncharacterized protein YbaA (DUF1428 family)